ncbi:CAP domain-containing protein [Jatrophihabitans sp. GAS493]|uniref:CAP domain-containing protein n=1 Tax=Jatrophihabitans sp. GAS493 TaxID=1907575 RepID=UPI001A7E0A7F|nr:CAP domain-containing protein [Jatrophihabitans sp. GAS493]
MKPKAKAAPRPAVKPAVKPVVKASSLPVSSSIAYSVLSRLNADRAKYGAPALHMSGSLVAAAHNHNLAMASANVMAHQVSGEAGLSSRLARVGYGWSACAENIGWSTNLSTSGALGLDGQMMAEVAPNDGHRVNILSTKYTQVGIDVVLDSATGKLWLTEDFGQPG